MCAEDHNGNNKIIYSRGRVAERQSEKETLKSNCLQFQMKGHAKQMFATIPFTQQFTFNKFLF